MQLDWLDSTRSNPLCRISRHHPPKATIQSIVLSEAYMKSYTKVFLCQENALFWIANTIPSNFHSLCQIMPDRRSREDTPMWYPTRTTSKSLPVGGFLKGKQPEGAWLDHRQSLTCLLQSMRKILAAHDEWAEIVHSLFDGIFHSSMFILCFQELKFSEI